MPLTSRWHVIPGSAQRGGRLRVDQACTAAGFTLVEMAIVMVILGLLLVGGLSLVGAQNDGQRVKDSEKLLEEAKEALMGFAASHVATDGRPYLPCPDKTAAAGAGTANDGQEDRNGNACVTQEGNLPLVTLGLANQADPFGNRLRYRVSAAYSDSGSGFLTTTAGDLLPQDTGGTALASAGEVPVVVLSHGKNGYGAINAAGTATAAPPVANTNETENADGDTTFVAGPPVDVGGAGGEFDDIVSWLPRAILFNRMIQAGKL